MTLTDEVLAEILGDAEFDIADGRDVFRTHPRVVADIIREVQRLRKVEREHYDSTHCHCGRGLTMWSEPACDGCDRVPENCHCEPTPKEP